VRLGILGGTFNPPHLGHLICAQEAHTQLKLDSVMFIPAGVPPHKALKPGDPDGQRRYDLCVAATGDDPRFQVSDIELRRAGPSYTADTLQELHVRIPDSELFLIVGADTAASLPSWHQPERVVALATLAVAKRRGTTRDAVDDALAQIGGGERAEFFRMPRVGISSTDIRRRVKAQEPITYLVPQAVASYIDEHRLYGGRTQS
jgi:nicotinate-nucleotide adenylyltransferase